jgi:hypothetical protein
VFAAMLARKGSTDLSNVLGGQYGFPELCETNGSNIAA